MIAPALVNKQSQESILEVETQVLSNLGADLNVAQRQSSLKRVNSKRKMSKVGKSVFKKKKLGGKQLAKNYPAIISFDKVK